MVLDGDLKQALLDAASAAMPSEMCGLLVESGGRLSFVQTDNAAANPQTDFEISPAEWMRAEAAGSVAAVVHSHVDAPLFLSGADRKMQVQTGLPWVLVADGLVRVFRCCPHLRGRRFDYGLSDCGALVRDAYMLMGLDFPDCTRSDMDIDASSGVLPGHLSECGFVRASDGIVPGDVLTVSYAGDENHALLVLPDGMLLHHAYGHLSRREVLTQWWRDRVVGVWRHPRFLPDMMQAVANDLNHAETVL